MNYLDRLAQREYDDSINFFIGAFWATVFASLFWVPIVYLIAMVWCSK